MPEPEPKAPAALPGGVAGPAELAPDDTTPGPKVNDELASLPAAGTVSAPAPAAAAAELELEEAIANEKLWLCAGDEKRAEAAASDEAAAVDAPPNATNGLGSVNGSAAPNMGLTEVTCAALVLLLKAAADAAASILPAAAASRTGEYGGDLLWLRPLRCLRCARLYARLPLSSDPFAGPNDGLRF